MATRWHSCPRDVPLPCLHPAQDHTPLPDCCTPGWTLLQKSLSWFGYEIVALLFTTIFWVITGKKKKLYYYFPWFKWWLLFKCPVLLFNTITIRGKKLSMGKWIWKPSTVSLGGLSWKKNCFTAFTKAAYCMCSMSVSALDSEFTASFIKCLCAFTVCDCDHFSNRVTSMPHTYWSKFPFAKDAPLNQPQSCSFHRMTKYD